MKLRVLGCDGGRGLGYGNTTLLFNDHVLIDAGTIQSSLNLEEALKITDIFFSHSHLDHIIDLPFLLDATFEKRMSPLRVHGQKETLDPMMEHIFNNKIWPNFSHLPSKDKGQFTLHEIKPNKTYEADHLKFTPIRVDHTVPTVGYKVEDDHAAVIFTADTGPTEEIWEVANHTPNLKAVIVDLSFPVSEQHIADISKHMTADDIAEELKKLKVDCDVYAFHYKVGMGGLLNAQAHKIKHFGKPIKSLRDYTELVF